MIFTYCPFCHSILKFDQDRYNCPYYEKCLNFKFSFSSFNKNFLWAHISYTTIDYQYEVYITNHESKIFVDQYHHKGGKLLQTILIEDTLWDTWDWSDVDSFKKQINTILAFS